MLLAVDVGNTQTVFGLYDGAGARRALADRAPRRTAPGTSWARCSRTSSTSARSTGSASPRRCRGWSASTSTSPSAGRRRSCSCVGPGVRTGIPIEHDEPRDVGPDRIVNAVAAKELFGAPAIVADFGTSTNFDVVSPAGAYVGGVLAPGIEVSMDALFARAARLVEGRLRRAAAGDRQDDRRRAAVGARLRLRRPGRRHRRRDPGRARRGGAGDRDGRPRRPDRPALADDRPRRAVPHARRAPDRLGAEREARSTLAIERPEAETRNATSRCGRLFRRSRGSGSRRRPRRDAPLPSHDGSSAFVETPRRNALARS